MTSARLYVARSPLHDSYQHPGCRTSGILRVGSCRLTGKVVSPQSHPAGGLLLHLKSKGRNSWGCYSYQGPEKVSTAYTACRSVPEAGGLSGTWAKRLQQQSHRCHQLWRGRVLVSACVAWFWVARHNHTKAILLLELELDCPLTRQALSPHDLHGLQGMKGQLKVGMFYKGLLEHNGLCLLQRRVGAPW